ncbi:hypothetical protein [Dactylosporangium sp. CS-033363]|uniref:hypothetical protein n=1 Tax=Dactylosporangium sp. CS-033363 TaxID=3239935 RepID=UPI003D8DB66E
MNEHFWWCGYCTAYGHDADGYHRSSPVVITTDDPHVQLYVHKGADADGTDEYVEIAALDCRTTGQPWHLREPIRALYLPRATADAVWRAVQAFVLPAGADRSGAQPVHAAASQAAAAVSGSAPPGSSTGSGPR